MRLVMRFIKDESGATATEYGLIVAAISLAIITVATALAAHMKISFMSLPGDLP